MSKFDNFLLSLTEDQKKALVSSLLSDSEEDTPDTPSTPDDEMKDEYDFSEGERGRFVEEKKPAKKNRVTVNKDFSVIRESSVGGKTPVKAKKNQWVDTGEAKDEEFDPEHFKKLGITERVRPEKVLQERVCHVCGRKFKIDPDLVHGEFIRCNNCVG